MTGIWSGKNEAVVGGLLKSGACRSSSVEEVELRKLDHLINMVERLKYGKQDLEEASAVLVQCSETIKYALGVAAEDSLQQESESVRTLSI